MFKIIITSEQLDLPKADLYITGVNVYVWVCPMTELRDKMLAEHYKDIPEVVSEQETAPVLAFAEPDPELDKIKHIEVVKYDSNSKERQHNTLRYTPKSNIIKKELKITLKLKNKINKIIGGII